MKKWLILCLALVSSPSYSYDYCTELSLLAEQLMKNRQIGMSAASIAKDAGKFKWMVIETFKYPRYNTKKFQQRAITEFGSQMYVLCEDAMEKGD